MTETSLKTSASEVSIVIRKDELGLTRVILPKADINQDDCTEVLLRVQSEIEDELENIDVDAWRARRRGVSVDYVKFCHEHGDMPLQDAPKWVQEEFVKEIFR